MTTLVRRNPNLNVLIIVLSVTVACSGASGGPTPTGPTPMPAPDGWLTYSDATYGFAVSYPPDHVILPESTPLRSGVVKQVQIQDKQIASGPFANREPERLLVEVFAWTQPTSLETWLRSVDRLPPDAEVSSFSWPNAREAVSVRRQAALAPGEFYYFSTNRHVYALTPLGDGLRIAETFVILQ